MLHVPVGTVVRDPASGEVLGDLVEPGARLVAAAGGRGGRGNARFATATHQAPRLGELGAPGERRRLKLELKLIADIGLVGLPNAGKSTLLAALTGAHPRIAPYPFTTLAPNLGVAELESGRTLVLADVPGLIAGAHQGAGLGLDFLRHLERTRALVEVVDAAAGPEAARDALATVAAELSAFSPALAARPRLVALNKCDLEPARAAAATLTAELPEAVAISAASGAGCPDLLEAAARLAVATPPSTVEAVAGAVAPPVGGHRVYRHRPRQVVVSREGTAYRVSGPAVERRVAMTDLGSDEAVVGLQRWLRTTGVDAALAEAGCAAGDTVRIGAAEFDYADDVAVP